MPIGRGGIRSLSVDSRTSAFKQVRRRVERQSERMDEELAESGTPTVGQRLRAAREEKGLSLEDLAAR